MLSDTELMASLAYHEMVFLTSSNNLRISLLSSKASILEVCGWVEQAMDTFVLDSANRCALSATRIKHIEEKYVAPTYGFSYKTHFEKMVTSVVGYKVLEQAERNAGNVIPAMESTLNFLAKLRNHYAHTHFDIADPYPKGISSIPSPTVMRTHANTTSAALIALETWMIANHH